MRPDHTVLIVGAGPTGITMAIELKRSGIPVRIIDKAYAPAQHSQALVVQARTLEQFERYGIADEAIRRGRKLLRGSAVSEQKTILEFDLSQIPGRYPFVLFLPQSETERLLTEHLRSLGCEIERGTELLSFQNRKDGVEAELRHKSGVAQMVPTRWLIGCDGAHSAVRKGMNVPFTGDAVGLHFFLGDFELTGPDVPGDELRLYLQHGNVVFMGRLSERLYRIIVVLHPDTEALANRQPTLADFQTAIDQSGARLTVSSPTWMTPFHIHQRKAERYRVDSAFLAGDASHIHSPVAGQGMNTGIQDAANLAWKITAVADGASPRLLDTYDEERGGVGDKLLKITSLGLSAATNDNPIFRRLRDLILPSLGSLEPVRRAMAGFASETAIEYRGSSIVADYGGEGSLRAGDRVPNVVLEYAGGRRGSLLDALENGRALALGIGIKDVQQIRARVPRGGILELEGPEGMLGTTMAGIPDARTPEALRSHTLSSEFPAAGTVSGCPSASGLAASTSWVALLSPEVAQLLGERNRIAVIRPDGYLGFRGSCDDLARLDDYARLTGLV